ncbi:MAG TPA: hypothetical protein VFL57_09035 [Bryobacteraceae bacterium]|nr:hypothetical protein [Bryobacteraceae bacterium]
MRLYQLLLALLAGGCVVVAQPAVDSIVNAASYDPAVPRGGLVSLFGTDLARSTLSATSTPLPKRLDGTSVLVGDLELEAPLYFVSPTQINFQVPFEALGDRLSIVVVTAAGRSRPFLVRLTAAGPGIFTRSSDGKGRALVFSPAFEPVEVVSGGEPIIFYATGLGPTNPPALSGTAGAAVEPFHRLTYMPEVFLGEMPARVVFAGLAPGLAGVYQLNVIPQTAATDRLWIRSRGQISNFTDVGIRAGQNVTNARGTIELLYPTARADAEPVGYSPHLLVARFTARLDIAPNADAFSVAAVSDGGASSIIRFDPANDTFEGIVSVPAEAPRYGDFSRTGFSPVDLFSCHNLSDGTPVCQPFPNAIIPASRIPPAERRALDLLPLPDAPVAQGATGELRIRGIARRGSSFAIDADNNARLSTFAGYVTVPLPPAPSRTATLKLFIDGHRVASTEVSYRVGPYSFQF